MKQRSTQTPGTFPLMATEEEKEIAAQWIRDALDRMPPFSFRYRGEPSAQLLPQWPATRSATAGADGTTLNTVVYRDAASGLECVLELTEYPDSSAVEWVVRFRNTGNEDTPIIEDIQALDLTRPLDPKMQAYLHYSKGTQGEIDDFALQKSRIKREAAIELKSAGSSSGNFLPFMNIEMGQEGLILGIGWTGRWACTFQRRENWDIAVRAGMAKTHLRLHPGEEIRTPRILLLFWRDDVLRGHNLLRRHLVAHHLPHPGGREVEPPICNATWGGMKTANHLNTVQFITDHGLAYDCYWIDAGWFGPDHETEEFQNFYTEDWAYHIGHWRVNRTVHPQGLKPISEAVHGAGMKLLLWFSPYSAEAGSPMATEHPEWTQQRSSWGQNGIGLNKKTVDLRRIALGVPETRRFLLDTISGLIAEHGVDCFRDDNSLPLPDAEQETPDRQGIGEIRCVEGFYAFWDELLRRHPGLLIDNCGGGGTRIDLETIGRSLVLHRTDYNCDPDADPVGFQVGTHGLSHWVPLVGGGPPSRPGDTYNIRSGWCGGLPFSLFHACGFGQAATAPAPDYPVEWHRRMIADYRRVLPYFKGDFYPLTDCTVSQKEWFAYQMDRPDLGEGVVVAFRRRESPFVKACFNLHGLAAAPYEVTDLDSGNVRKMAGKRLCGAGLIVEIKAKPGSVVMVYRKKAQS